MTALQLWLFTDFGREPVEGGRKALFAAVTFVASWASIYCVLFSVSLGIADILARRSMRRSVLWWLPVGLLCVPAVVYYAIQAINTPTDIILSQKSGALYLNFMFVVYGHLVGQTYGPPLAALRADDRFSVLISYWPDFAIPGFVLALLCWQMLRRIWQSRSADVGAYGFRVIGFAMIALVALSVIMAIATEHSWLPRHAFALHVMLAIILPVAASQSLFGLGSWWRQIPVVLMCMLNVWALENYYYIDAYSKDDYRAAARYIKYQHMLGRPAVLLEGRISLLRYYGDDNTIFGELFGRLSMACEIRAALPNANEVLVVINREFDFEGDRYVTGRTPQGLIVSLMSPAYKLMDATTFQYFKIYQFAFVSDGFQEYRCGWSSTG